jgi:hypothetical protein
MNQQELFAKRVFLGAGIYGLVVIAPQYFLETSIGHAYPPPINHPENFYGFIGVALAWQFAFLIIAKAPLRLRPVMLAATAEKFLVAISTLVLLCMSRVPDILGFFAAIDLVLGALFLLSYLKLRSADVNH